MKLDDKTSKLGKYSVQCDSCINCTGMYLCSVYNETPEEYWMNEKKCPDFTDIGITSKGGVGSGNFGHAGRPGKIGGSAPSSGISMGVSAGVKKRVVKRRGINRNFKTPVAKKPSTRIEKPKVTPPEKPSSGGIRMILPKSSLDNRIRAKMKIGVQSKWLQKNLTEAVNEIEKVHSVPNYFPEITVEESKTGTKRGALVTNSITSLPLKMRISSKNMSNDREKEQDGTLGVFAHEFGHYIDYSIKNSNFMNSTTSPFEKKDIDDIFSAIEASKNNKFFKKVLSGEIEEWDFKDETYYRPEDKVTKKMKISKSMVRYLMQRDELFARAYSQWIVKKTGNKKIMKYIEGRRDFRYSISKIYYVSEYPSQWDWKDFEPISKAFDKLFDNAGLLRG